LQNNNQQILNEYCINLLIIKDFAPAQGLAGDRSWGSSGFLRGMCASHVSGRWFDKHKTLVDQVFCLRDNIAYFTH
jgi:hypothetical protein